MKIIIVRPHGYSGGCLVLEEMCSQLRKIGIDARLFYIFRPPRRDTNMIYFWWQWFVLSIKYHLFSLLCQLFPVSSNRHLVAWSNIVKSPTGNTRRKEFPFFSRRNTIVVYPETVYGNFLHAKNVVRYLMYYYEYSNDSYAYGKDDLFIAFREVFDDRNLNLNGYLVRLNYFDRTLYKQYNFGKRAGNCYIIRKGRNRADLPKQFDGPIIDNLLETEKVRVLNECERCYSYDMQTFYSSIAALCGCLSILVPEEGKVKEDYYALDDEPLGISFGESPDEIDYAQRTRELLEKKLDFEEQNINNVNILVDILKKEFDWV